MAYETDFNNTDDEVELPASLEGTFEIRIIEDEWLFYGEIEL